MLQQNGTPLVLIVDDSPINLKLMSCMLEKLGISCCFAENGRQALQQLQKFDFNLVLMDCMMPVMDGYEATLLIRDPAGEFRNKTVPIVAVTAFTDRCFRERCRNAGMNDFLEKPLNMERLTSVIQRWLAVELPQNRENVT